LRSPPGQEHGDIDFCVRELVGSSTRLCRSPRAVNAVLAGRAAVALADPDHDHDGPRDLDDPHSRVERA
jgi:hypothetical protein